MASRSRLTDSGLYHPPCHGLAANRAFYACRQIAQSLLRSLQFQLPPLRARVHGLRPLIRHLVQTVARVVRTGQRLRLLFAQSNCRLDCSQHAAGRLEPSSGRGPG